METEQTRWVMSVSAVFGGVLTGLYTIGLALASRQKVAREDLVRLAFNVVSAMLSGGIAAYFLGPWLATLVAKQVADPHVVGFAIGFFILEAVPLAPKVFRALAEKLTKEKI